MKRGIFAAGAALLLCGSLFAQSELPAIINDKPISDNFDYIFEQILKLRADVVSPGSYLGPTTAFSGDVTGTYNTMAVGNDSHSHSDSTLTGLSASKLTGPLPAISGAALTDVVHTTATLEAVLAAVQAAISTAAYTTESYSNPAWITSLAGAKITGVLFSTAPIPAGLVDLSTVTTVLAGKLTAPATFYIPTSSDYQAPGAYITSLTGAVTASGPGAAAATIVSVPQGAVNLSTVTANHVLKAGDNMTGALSVSSNVIANAYQIAGGTVVAVVGGVDDTGSLYLGYHAGENSPYPVGNVFVGPYSGASTNGVSAGNNTFIGLQAGYTNTSGSNNTFLGQGAGYQNLSGYGNVYAGVNASGKNDSGYQNVIIGEDAGGGFNTAGASIEINNSVMLGWRAGYKATTGPGNIFIGQSAGYSTTTGEYNIHIGYQTGSSNTTGNRNIIIGNNVEAPAAGTNDYLNIGGILVGDIAKSSATILGSLSANTFYGDGSNLTGVSGISVYSATATIQANYGISASTIVVTGNSFSVGGSTLVAYNGAIGLGTSTPTAGIQFGVGNTISVNTTDSQDNQFACLAGGGALANNRGSLLCTYGNERLNNAGRILLRAGNVVANNTTDGVIAFQVGPSATQALTINATGYIGVNTQSPGSTLHVNGDVTAGSVTMSSATVTGNIWVKNKLEVNGPYTPGTFGDLPFLVGGSGGENVQLAELLISTHSPYVPGTGVGIKFSNAGGYPFGAIGAVAEAFPNDAGALVFHTNSGGTVSEKVRITSGGNVGIGTTAPGAKLEVNGNIVSSGTINAQNGLCINNDCKTVWGAGTGDAVLAATQTFTGTNSFTSLSTMTISGTIDIGWEIKTNSCASTNVCTVDCSVGKVLIGGGCSGGGLNNAFVNNYPQYNMRWYCGTESSANIGSYAICARIKP